MKKQTLKYKGFFLFEANITFMLMLVNVLYVKMV